MKGLPKKKAFTQTEKTIFRLGLLEGERRAQKTNRHAWDMLRTKDKEHPINTIDITIEFARKIERDLRVSKDYSHAKQLKKLIRDYERDEAAMLQSLHNDLLNDSQGD